MTYDQFQDFSDTYIQRCH